MLPMSEVATTVYRPFSRAAMLRMTSTTLPNVAFSRPPTASPKRSARSSVMSPRMSARGTRARKFWGGGGAARTCHHQKFNAKGWVGGCRERGGQCRALEHLLPWHALAACHASPHARPGSGGLDLTWIWPGSGLHLAWLSGINQVHGWGPINNIKYLVVITVLLQYCSHHHHHHHQTSFLIPPLLFGGHKAHGHLLPPPIIIRQAGHPGGREDEQAGNRSSRPCPPHQADGAVPSPPPAPPSHPRTRLKMVTAPQS